MAKFGAASDALTAALAVVDAQLRNIDVNEQLELYIELIDRRAKIQNAIGASGGGGGSSSITTNTSIEYGAGATTAKTTRVAIAADANSVVVASETGFLNFRNTALTNTASQIKATAGQMRGWNLINPNATPVYVKFYDALAANVVVGTTAVVRTLAVPSGGAFFLEAQSVSQDDFATAISVTCVTGLADSNATAPLTPIHAGVRYK